MTPLNAEHLNAERGTSERGKDSAFRIPPSAFESSPPDHGLHGQNPAGGESHHKSSSPALTADSLECGERGDAVLGSTPAEPRSSSERGTRKAERGMVAQKAAAVQENLDTLAAHLEREQRALENSMGKELGERLSELGL